MEKSIHILILSSPSCFLSIGKIVAGGCSPQWLVE